MIGLVWSLLASLILIGCGGAKVAQMQDPQSPQWTVENPNATAGRNLGSSAEAKRLTSATFQSGSVTEWSEHRHTCIQSSQRRLLRFRPL